MLKVVLAFAVLAGARAGSCSSADQALLLADPDDVGKKQNKCGHSSLSRKGIDHDKFTSCAQKELGISSDCSECYYAVAKYGFKNCKTKCVTGWCKSGCLSCTKPAQDTLATCSGFKPAEATPCLETEIQKGSCSSADKALLSDPNDVGKKQDTCGHSSLSLKGIDHDKFTSCVKTQLKISSSCSECYYAVAKYGFKNCKTKCVTGWCKSGCLSCTKPAQDTLATCSGLETKDATPCLETQTDGCSSADQATIQGMDANTFGEKSNKCGTGSLSLSGIDHDKFVTCMGTEVGISSNCAGCYHTTAQYGFKNCKLKCLAGWCKQGCLDCTAPAQSDLPKCTGIPVAGAAPCLEVSV